MAVNLTVVTTVDALLFRAAGGFEARDVVAIYRTADGGTARQASYLDFADFRQQNRSFENLAAWKPVPASITRGGETFRVRAMLATAGYFELLRLQPQRGRFFTASEDRVPDAVAVMVVSDAFWRSRLGGGDVIGQDLVVNGRPFRIVGIAPPRFESTSATQRPQIFVPMMMQPSLMPQAGNLLGRRGWQGISMIGRLRRGVAPAAASAELSAIAARLGVAYPDTARGLGVRLEPISKASLPPSMRASAERMSVIWSLVGGCALLLICANVANLLLVRTLGRARDLAVRVALGAGRWTMLRQFAVESLLLAGAGGIAGVAFTAFLIRVLRASVPLFDRISITSSTLLAAPLLIIAVAVICAATPLFVISQSDAQRGLRGGTGSASRGAQRTINAVVVVQIGLAVTLLVSTGLFVRTLVQLSRIAVGYDEQLVVTPLRLLSGAEQADVLAYYDSVLARVRAIPRVESAAIGSHVPLAGESDSLPVSVGDSDRRLSVGFQIAGAGFFRTLGIGILRGRDFDASDRGAASVCIVNDSLARQLAADGNAIGMRLRRDPDTPPLEVVGVVADSRFTDLREAAEPTMYFAHAQAVDHDLARNMSLFVRAQSAAAVARELPQMLRVIDPAVPNDGIETIAVLREHAASKERNLSRVFAAIALLALGLASLGLYGVLSLSVTQRTREIAIRIALGASAGNLLRLTMARGAKLAIAGTAVGVATQLALNRAVGPLLFETQANDAVVWTVVVVCTAAVVLAASYLPASRAGRIDPVVALKYQ